MTAPTQRGLAFANLGIPNATVTDLVRAAQESGVHELELRCAEGELLEPSSTPAFAAALRAELDSHGLSVLCVASYVRVSAFGGDRIEEIVHHVRLAEALGAPYVRVFGGVEGQHSEQEALASLRLAEVARRIRDSDVVVLLETHDVFLTGAAVARVLDGAAAIQLSAASRLGALWDVLNPWRAGEDIARTALHLSRWLQHVQVKDAVSPTELAPVLPGTGAVPLRALLQALDAVNYTGPLSLEWERVWYPSAPPVEEALASLRTILSAYETDHIIEGANRALPSIA